MTVPRSPRAPPQCSPGSAARPVREQDHLATLRPSSAKRRCRERTRTMRTKEPVPGTGVGWARASSGKRFMPSTPQYVVPPRRKVSCAWHCSHCDLQISQEEVEFLRFEPSVPLLVAHAGADVDRRGLHLGTALHD